MDAAMGTDSSCTHVLVDGFPRSEDNLTTWAKVVGDKLEVKCLLYFKLS
jgi:hypothetical protein